MAEPSEAAAVEPGETAVTEPREVAEGMADPAATEAANRYDRGLRFYSEGDFELAVIEFERAYALAPDYRTLYNIGQVRIQLGDYARAHGALTRYLEQGGQAIPAERRARVLSDLATLRTKTALLTIETSVSGAQLFVDEVLFGSAPLHAPVRVDAGTHSVEARLDGYRTKSATLTVAGQDETRVELTLEPLEVPAPTERIIVQRETVVHPEDDNSAWKWGAWTATGVFAVGATVTGLLGASAAKDLDQQRSQLGADRDELDSASRRAATLLGTADVLGALTLVAGGAALYLTLSESDADAEDTRDLGVLVHPRGVGVTGEF